MHIRLEYYILVKWVIPGQGQEMPSPFVSQVRSTNKVKREKLLICIQGKAFFSILNSIY